MRLPSAKVAILGGGVSGLGAAQLLRHLKVQHIIFDANPNQGAAWRGDDGFDYVVMSPSFQRSHPWMRGVPEDKMMAELDLAALYWRGPIVGVTGTVGKSTVTEFAAHVCRCGGIKAIAVGNNGVSFAAAAASELNDGRVAVCEISSFQAEQVKYLKLQALLWTNIFPNHLDVHGNFENYFKAKLKLIDRIINYKWFTFSQVCTAAQNLGFETSVAATLVDTAHCNDEHFPAFCTAAQLQNYTLVRAWALDYGFEAHVIDEAARTFQALKHRLQVVAEDELRFWDDSKATTSVAVKAALGSFSEPVVWIAGGRSKGQSAAAFIQDLDEVLPKIVHAYLIGETANDLQTALSARGKACTVCQTLSEAVSCARQARYARDVVLSPGFASFDQFRDYGHRGDTFTALARGELKDVDSTNVPASSRQTRRTAPFRA